MARGKSLRPRVVNVSRFCPYFPVPVSTVYGAAEFSLPGAFSEPKFMFDCFRPKRTTLFSHYR